MTPTKLLGLLFVIVYIVALKVFETLDVQSVFEPHLLLPLLNTLFHGIIPVIVAYVAGKSYMRGGSVTVLFMGCGMLAFGLSAILAGWLIRASDGANVTVTVHNTGVFLGSLFQATAAVIGIILSDLAYDAGRRKAILFITYSGIVLFMLCFSFAALRALIPPFFIQGIGPTHLRQSILGSSILLYFVSCTFFMVNYFRLKSDFLYWYSLCLALICVGLFGIFIQKAVGSPMGWLGRSALYVGGIFALAAVLSALRDAKVQGRSLEQSIADSFEQVKGSYWSRLLAALPIPTFLILLVIVSSLDLKTLFEPPGLRASLNTLFLGIFPLGVAYFSTKGYLHSGLFTMFMIGSGALTLGLGSLLSGWTLSLQDSGPNATATILNLAFVLSAIFNLFGAASVFIGAYPRKESRHKGLIVACTYIGITFLMTILTAAALKGLLPAFFIQGQGPTPLRQVVLGSAVVLFCIAGLLFLSVYLFSKARMLYWYSLALLLITTGLLCYMTNTLIGSPVSWLGRVSLYLAGIYVLVAVISASKELQVRGESPETGVANLFRHHLESLVEERTLQLSGAREELQSAHTELERANAELDFRFKELSEALQSATRYNDLLKTIQKTQIKFIANASPEQLYQDLLHDILILTNSEFGFIGEILYTDDGRAYLRDRAIKDISWDEESRKTYEKFADAGGLDFYDTRGLWGAVIQTGEPVISNDPANDPRACGIPDGHPPLQSFLGLPFHSGDQVIGMAGIANRPDGYDNELVEFLQPYITTCANIIEARRNEDRRREAEKLLQQKLDALRQSEILAHLGYFERNWQSGSGYWSDGFFKLLGREPGPGFAPEDFTAYIHEDDRKLVADRLKDSLDSHEPMNIKFRIIQQSGNIVHVHGITENAYDDKGQPLLTRGTFQDITGRKKTEDELRTTLLRFYTILSNLHAGLLLATEEGRIEFANQAFCDQFELEGLPANLHGLTASEIIEQIKHVYAEPAKAVTRLQEIVEQQRSVKGEELAIRGGRTYLRDFTPIRVDGKPYGSLWHHQDITERKLAEKALHEARNSLEVRVKERTAELEQANLSLQEEMIKRQRAEESVTAERERLYEILEAMPVMVCLLTADHRVAFANRGFREKFGEGTDRHCFDIIFGSKEPSKFCEAYNVLKTGKPHQWEVTGPDGAIFEVHNSPFADTDGSPLILEIDIDITERRRAEEALRTASAYNRRLIETSLDPLVTISAEGKITDVNTATEKVTGRSREELIGTEFADYFTEPEKARLGYAQVFRTGLVKNYELAIRHRNGWLTPVMYNASVYRDDSEKIIGVFAAARDISDRKRAEEELIRSNQDLQQFAYVASHDLQEPLRNVATCVQMLKEKYKNKLDADADQYIHYAVDGAVRMKALLQGLLEYSRVTTMGKPPGRTDCEQIIDRAVKNLRSAISEADAVITHDPLPTIIADDTQVLQVFQNLIQNAIKFRKDEPPRVHISAVKSKDEWVFSVNDNGIGIEAQHFERIFVIFQRLHKRSQYEGRGMGLAIVKKVVERHGGRVWAESESGMGATFCFTIPDKEIQA